MCSLAVSNLHSLVSNAVVDPLLWPQLPQANLFLPTYDVGGTECMVVTRADALCWVVYCHGNAVTLTELHDSGIPNAIVDACKCNFIAPRYPAKAASGAAYDKAVVEAAQRTYEQLCLDTSSPVYMVGRSIGVGIALQACANRPPAGVVLISGFSSVKALAPWGLQWLVPARLDNVAAIKALKGVPKLILHGEMDELVPPANAHLLAGACDCGSLCIIPHMTHVPTPYDVNLICREMVKMVERQRKPVTGRHYLLWKT